VKQGLVQRDPRQNRVIQGRNWECTCSKVGVSLHSLCKGSDVTPFFSKIFVNKKDQAKLSVHFSGCDFGQISFLAKNYWIHSKN
jgi:hypothetical protein